MTKLSRFELQIFDLYTAVATPTTSRKSKRLVVVGNIVWILFPHKTQHKIHKSYFPFFCFFFVFNDDLHVISPKYRRKDPNLIKVFTSLTFSLLPFPDIYI